MHNKKYAISFGGGVRAGCSSSPLQPQNSDETRNTFCGTWYLPHSRVHKSMAELCSNFGDSATSKGEIAFFYCAYTKRPYFYFWSKIWRHHHVPWPRFAIRFRNFGDSAINMGQIAYFSLRMRKTVLFLLPVKNLTSNRVRRPWFRIGCRNFVCIPRLVEVFSRAAAVHLYNHRIPMIQYNFVLVHSICVIVVS